MIRTRRRAGQYFQGMKQMIDLERLLSRGAVIRSYDRGEIIFEEGSQGRYYHQLVEGRVKWVNVEDSGREFVQKLVREGESFGELPLLDEGPYVASAVADVPSDVIRLPKHEFLNMLEEDLSLHFRFTRLMAERLREKFIVLREVSSPDPERKVSTILELQRRDAAEEGLDVNSFSRWRVPITRRDIASMTGLRVETVIRTIRQLHDKGKVQIQRGKVYY